jgi:hypothetical protein
MREFNRAKRYAGEYYIKERTSRSYHQLTVPHSLTLGTGASEGKQLHNLSFNFSTAIDKSKINFWLADHNSVRQMSNALNQSKLELHMFPHVCLPDWEVEFRVSYIGWCLGSGSLKMRACRSWIHYLHEPYTAMPSELQSCCMHY